MKMKRLLLASLLFAMLSACGDGDSVTKDEAPVKRELPADKNTLTEPATDNKIVVYQMMTRLFGNTVTNNKKWGSKEQNGVGKFGDISDTALSELKKLGVTHVWYTGVLAHASCEDWTSLGIALDDPDVVKGRAGSPYAIRDYYDVDPVLASDPKNRMDEWKALMKRTHDNGLSVIIDFVPNHVARRYHSYAKPDGVVDLGANDDNTSAFSPSNNFYYIVGKPFVAPKGNMTPGPDSNAFPGKDGKFDENPAKATGNDQFVPNPDSGTWFETVKLNYGVDIQNKRKKYFDPIPDTWVKMKDILVYWTKMGVDGFRCDMAEMVPVEFWAWAVPQVKAANPKVLFIAEIYSPGVYKDYIQKGKFDILYDKVGLYDTLKPLMQGKGNAKDIQSSWSGLKGITANMLRFLENHDEMRIAGKGFAKDPWTAVPAMTVTATLSTGPVMIYFGQEVGEPAKGAEGFGGDDSRTTIFDYWGVPEHQKWVNGGKFDGGLLSDDQKKLRAFYANLLNLCRSELAIREGKLYDLYFANCKEQSEGFDDHANYAYLRFVPGGETLLVAVNFSKTNEMKTFLKIPEAAWTNAGIDTNADLTAKDLLGFGADLSFNAAATLDREKLTAGVPVKLPPMSAAIYLLTRAAQSK
jgi:glycosidase